VLGVSFQELLLVSVVALLVLGPNKLPGVLRSLGRGIRKLRKLTTEVRSQSGIDDVLRAEGLEGGINELRSLVRSGTSGFAGAAARMAGSAGTVSRTPGKKPFQMDLSREYPIEGPDSNGALPEDLLPGAESAKEGSASASPPAQDQAEHVSASPTSSSRSSGSSSRPSIPRPASGAPRISTTPPPPHATPALGPEAPAPEKDDS